MSSRATEANSTEKDSTSYLPGAASKSFVARILRSIFPDQRRSPRLPSPPLIVQLGVSYSSKHYAVRDVSASGVYLLTHERWLPGTQMPISLLRTDHPKLGEFVTVQSTVVRNGEDGVGFRFLLADSTTDSSELDGARWVSRAEMNSFLRGIRQSSNDAFEEVFAKTPAEVRN